VRRFSQEMFKNFNTSTTITIAQITNIVSSDVVQEISLFKQLPQAEQYVGTILPQEEH
jgi:hypothetical protein